MNPRRDVPECIRRSKCFVLPAAFLLFASATIAGAEIIRVGTAAACDEDTLPLALLRAALNSDAADEIRLPKDTVYNSVSIHLTDWDPATAGALTIVGGYASCAGTSISGVTTLNGSPSSPIVEIDTASRPVSEVTLVALELKGGVWEFSPRVAPTC